jgi:hypothetical protein
LRWLKLSPQRVLSFCDAICPIAKLDPSARLDPETLFVIVKV